MKVLVTSGGGAKGAFSVGALQYLIEDAEVGRFDMISGTSTGSLIAAMIAANKLEVLTDVYLNTINDDILKPLNIIESIQMNRCYIYDTDPLLKQINTYVDNSAYNTIMQSNTLVCFNSVSLQTGKHTIFCTRPILSDWHYDQVLINSRNLMINGMLGSSNQAVFMNPVKVGDYSYVDGGNKEVIPTRAVVSNLTNESEHEIYVLSNNPHELIVLNRQFTNILDVMMRSITIFIQEVRENDLEVLTTYKKISPTRIKIYYICPDEELDPDFPTGLRFDKVRMQKWMRMGKSKAKKIVTKNPDGNL
jgi:predicted acylesterase/phospholipase RssA